MCRFTLEQLHFDIRYTLIIETVGVAAAEGEEFFAAILESWAESREAACDSSALRCERSLKTYVFFKLYFILAL